MARRVLFTRAIGEDWLLLWCHDRNAGGRLGLDKDGNFVVRELVAI